MHDCELKSKWALISKLSHRRNYHSTPMQYDLIYGVPNRNQLHSLLLINHNQDRHIQSLKILRLHGGAPQLSLFIGAIFLSMIYRCISISLTRDRSDNIQEIANNENLTQASILPSRKNLAREKNSISSGRRDSKYSDSPPQINGRTLENSAHSDSALDTGPVKMVLVVRTDLRMSTGKASHIEQWRRRQRGGLWFEVGYYGEPT